MSAIEHDGRDSATAAIATAARPGQRLGPSAELVPEPAAPAIGESTSRRRGGRLRWIVPIVLVVAAVGAIFGFRTYQEGALYVATDNAQLTGQPIQVGATSAGRVVSIRPSVGSTVRRGELLAQVELPTQVGNTPSGAPRMSFLDTADSLVDVPSPIDGVVIAVPSAVGATVAAGQNIVTLVDPTQLYVNANIEETKVSRLQPGQLVDVHVDALDETVPGRVEAITPATSAIFSLFPQTNTSGNFTKVTQLVPVRIDVNLGNRPLLLGSSASVKIHLAD